MKKKFSRILGVGLAFVLMVSLMAFAAPVSAGTLSWTAFSPVPSATNNVLEECDVVDIAVYDADIIYAGAGDTSDYLYKTADGGLTWSALIVDSTDNETDLVAVAPDDPDIVAYVHNLQVFFSNNGGSTWGDLLIDTTGMDTINDIAISADAAGVHYIGVAGIYNNIAKVATYNQGAAVATWRDASALGTAFSADSANSSAAAIAFSPNFASDYVMAVVTYEGDNNPATTDYVRLELFSENQDLWNAEQGTFNDYPATIVSDDDIDGLTSASLALGPDYLGSDDTMRLAFVGLNVAGGDDTAIGKSGIHRMDNVTHKALKEGTAVLIHSVTYDGSVLVAGRYDSNICYYCTDPTATSPTVSGTRTLKRPGMLDATIVTEQVVVAWAGDVVVAGTSGDSSAFAVSTNDGVSFNDISLIDTEDAELKNLEDVAVSADGSVTYLSTYDADGLSLWRYASAWERVLAVEGTNKYSLIRLAADDSDVVYVVEEDATAIYYSADGGLERWQARASRYNVQDLAVEGDGDVAYVLIAADGKVSKSTNAGFTWGTAASSKLTAGHMITSIGDDKVLATSTNGYVTYSDDGADTWTKIGKTVADEQVVATASGLADEDYIYAGTHDTAEDYRHIYRWQIGVSTAWTKITGTTADVNQIPADYECFGIALEDGILYASTSSGNDTCSLRTLGPSDTPTVYWSLPTSTAGFNAGPQALKVGGGKIWAIDLETTDTLYSYTDTLADVIPTLIGPRDNFEVSVNPVSGYAMDIMFSWEKPSDYVTAYNLYIKDVDGNTVKSQTVTTSLATAACVLGKDISDGDTTGQFSFMPGETYTWKVRVSSAGPIYSNFSETRTLTVTELEAAVITAPDVTVEAPEPVVVPAPVVTVPAPVVTIPAAAPIIPSYLLWTIIGIGAVLVIAVIVLIVRTRRVA